LQPGGPVDELADDIGMPSVPVGLGHHVDQDPVQGHLLSAGWPPRHVADRIQAQRLDRLVRVRPGPPVHPGDLITGLLGGGPQVGVASGIVRRPRPLAGRAPECIPEVPQLDTGQVLDQPEQVSAGRGQRVTDVVLGEPIKLPQQGIPGGLQVKVQVGFSLAITFRDRHSLPVQHVG